MAKLKDLKIENRLRRVVKDAVEKGDAITVKSARSKVEEELGLEQGFFINDLEWKTKSKSIIQSTFEETEGPDEEVESAKPSRKEEESSKAAKAPTKGDSEPTRSSKAEVKTGAKASTPNLSAKPAAEKRESSAETDESDSESSSDQDEDEDDEDESGSEDVNQPAAKTVEISAPSVNGVKRKAAEVSTASESDSEDESTSDSQPRKKAKGDSSAESDDTEEEDSDEASTSSPSNETAKTIPPQPFKVPSGYAALDISLLGSNSAFSQLDLEGKQVWHITAPSSVPLSTITELAFDAVQSQKTILTHNGIDYVAVEDQSRTSGNSDISILLPTKDGYERVPQHVSRALQLSQKISLPNLTVRQSSQVTGGAAAAQVAQASTSSVRPQPKGLKMRYRPPGFGSGSPGRIGPGSDSSTDGEDDRPAKAPTFQFPRTLGAPATSAQTDVIAAKTGADTSSTSLAKKAKKKKHDMDSAKPGTNGVLASSPERGKSTPAKEKVEMHTKVLGSSTTPATASKEDKAKRKEEKKAKKERRATQT